MRGAWDYSFLMMCCSWNTIIFARINQLQTQILPPPQPLGAEGPTYPEMTKEAVSNALSDAGLPYEAIQAAVRYSTP